MKEKPIIMSGESVRAILDLRKTMTRRVMKLPDNHGFGFSDVRLLHGKQTDDQRSVYEFSLPELTTEQVRLGVDSRVLVHPPYEVGDRLWVRESWSTLTYHEGDVPIHVLKDDEGIEHDIVYYAECPDFSWMDGDGFQEYRRDGSVASHWKSPMFMPRWASRITLEITDIRVEKVQDITEDDAIKEGCSGRGGMFLRTDVYPPSNESIPISEFRYRCDKLNAKRGYPWASNPWVWVISFKLLEGDI